MTTPPLRGWFLDVVLSVDATLPGFAGRTFRASNERRHVIAACLAQRNHPDLTEGEIELLSTGRHSRILDAAFGDVPVGLRQALGRCGSQPYERWFYRYLYGLLKSETRPEMRGFILSAPALSPQILKIARILPPELRHFKLVSALVKISQARDVSALFDLFISAGVDRDALIIAFASVRDWSDVRHLSYRWGLRCNFPAHPVPACEFYCPISNGKHLTSIGRQFRNCMSGYLVEILEGRSSFAVVRRQDHKAVVHLRKRLSSWVLDDIYGPHNDLPDANLEAASEDYLTQCGIGRYEHAQVARIWAPLSRLMGHRAAIVMD